jgi:hypothetical protein
MALRIYNLDPVTIVSGGTAYPVAATATPVASVTLQADYNNVGRISIGGPDVSNTNGIQIAPGEAAVIEYPHDTTEFILNEIYVTSASAGDIVRVTYMKRA